jgi:hypothetical protein
VLTNPSYSQHIQEEIIFKFINQLGELAAYSSDQTHLDMLVEITEVLLSSKHTKALFEAHTFKGRSSFISHIF